MRLRTRAWIGLIFLLTLAAGEMAFRPLQALPKPQPIEFEYTFNQPLKELAKDGDIDALMGEIDEEINGLKVGDYLVTRKEATNGVLIEGDKATRSEARAAERKIAAALKKKYGQVVLRRDNFDDLPPRPLAKLGPLAYYKPELQLNLGLDLQGGTHMVLQCRRALFEFKNDEPLWKSHEDAVRLTGELRATLRDRGLVDMDLRLPKEAPTRLVVRTQAETEKKARAHENLLTDVLKKRFRKIEMTRKHYYKLESGTLDQTIEIVRSRVDKLGVAEPLIQKQGSDRIVVELPGVADPDRAIELIGTTARLEFRKLPEKYVPKVEHEDGREVTTFETREGDPVPTDEVLAASTQLILTGDNLEPTATVGLSQFNQPEVNLVFDKIGKKKFGDFTRRNVKKYLAIWLDDEVISCPIIREAITGGRCVISGGFRDTEEAKVLRDLLNAGALPVPIDVVENRTVSATLGADSLHRSLVAGLWGLVVVAVFMLVWYRAPGLLADVSLLIYGTLVLAALVLAKATLTLPGMAGIILSIGMAVDANVIIFERMKEELRANKTLRAGIDAGFARAWTAILDSQVTTLIAAAVLFIYGTGPIRGFAVTLGIGVLVNMFTAITVTHKFLIAVAGTPLAKSRALFLR